MPRLVSADVGVVGVAGLMGTVVEPRSTEATTGTPVPVAEVTAVSEEGLIHGWPDDTCCSEEYLGSERTGGEASAETVGVAVADVETDCSATGVG